MARPKSDVSNVTVSARISPAQHAALEEYRWSNRVDRMSDLVRLAVEEFITAKKITVADVSDK